MKVIKEKSRIILRMEETMISAAEAKRRTQENIENCATTELQKTEDQINKAISNGKFALCNNGYLHPEVREKLVALGYEIETGNPRNEPYYCIRWS